MSGFEIHNNFIQLPSKDKINDVYINLAEFYDYIEVYGLLPTCKHYNISESVAKQWYKSESNYLHIRKLDCNILPYLSNYIVELLIHNAMKNNKLLRELIETLLNFFVLQPQLSQDLRELAIALRLYPMLLGLLS